MSDKAIVFRAFNNLFFEFLDEVQKVISDNEDIKDAITGFKLFKKGNPTSIIKAWKVFVYNPYKEHIDKGDINFFCEKNYESDVSHMSNSHEIMMAIQRIREPIRSMNEDNKKVVMKYVSNLCRLCLIYSNL